MHGSRRPPHSMQPPRPRSEVNTKPNDMQLIIDMDESPALAPTIDDWSTMTSRTHRQSISIMTLLSFYLVTAMPDNDNRQSFMFFLLLTWNGGKSSELCEGFVSIPLGSPKWRCRCTVGHFLDLLVYERRYWYYLHQQQSLERTNRYLLLNHLRFRWFDLWGECSRFDTDKMRRRDVGISSVSRHTPSGFSFDNQPFAPYYHPLFRLSTSSTSLTNTRTHQTSSIHYSTQNYKTIKQMQTITDYILQFHPFVILGLITVGLVAIVVLYVTWWPNPRPVQVWISSLSHQFLSRYLSFLSMTLLMILT